MRFLPDPLTFTADGGDLKFKPDGILFNGMTHPYDSVTHLRRFARNTLVNFIPLGQYVRVQIYLKGQNKPITIQNKFGFVGTTRRIEGAFAWLGERTFENRLRSYLQELEQKGYFEYGCSDDGYAKFFPDGEITIDSDHFNIHSSKISLEPFFVVFKKPSGLLNKKRKISTELDADIFLALLKRLYRIELEKGVG